MIIFYVRVSSLDQNEERQVQMAKANKAKKIFIEKKSGKNMDRPELKKLLGFVREGDTVMVESISRIARNVKDLLNIIDDIKAKEGEFVSLKENINTKTPTGKFMLTVFGALAELERDSIRERQAEGIAIAKKEGKYHGRPPMNIDSIKFKALVNEVKEKKRTAVSVMKEFNITATTYYRWVNNIENSL